MKRKASAKRRRRNHRRGTVLSPSQVGTGKSVVCSIPKAKAIDVTTEVLRQLAAENFAQALRCTTDRYLTGMMARPTWRSHMRALWGLVDQKGLRELVTKIVAPHVTEKAP